MGDFLEVFSSKLNLEPGEPLICPQKLNLPNLQKMNLELNQVRPNTNAHSSSSKDEKSEKKFQLYICFIKKIPRIEQLTSCNYMQKRPLEDAWVQKKVSALFFQQKCQEWKNLLQLPLYDMTEKSLHFITKISRIELHATAIPCKRGHSKMLSAQ